MRFCTLASGSSGNAIVVDGPAGAFLIDAGISGKRIAEALRCHSLDPARLQGVVVTHAHRDHVKSAGVIARKYGLPLFMTAGTYDAAAAIMGRTDPPRRLSEQGLRLAGFDIEVIPTPHDADESVALLIRAGGVTLGVLTDLGHAFDGLNGCVANLDAVILESNYDPDLLAATTRYPEWLKRRIRGTGGHLANAEAANLLQQHAGDGLRAILLAHLSENSNTPAESLRTFQNQAADLLAANQPLLDVAPRHHPSRLFTVEPLH
jgi:phosphoribosyl 1,2-cyclic phosphodiesterase